MTSPYEPPLNSDYLFVKLLVRKDGEEVFRRGMGITQDTVFRDKLRWRLVRAGKRIFPALEDKDEKDHVEFLHLWQTDNPINLWQGQFTVASDSDYASLYRQVDREEQNILRVSSVYCPTSAFQARAKPFLLVHEVALEKDWSQMLDWQWKLPVPVGNDDAAPPDFGFSFAFQSATGVLRKHFQFFEADKRPDLERLDRLETVGPGSAPDPLERLSQPRERGVDLIPDRRGRQPLGRTEARLERKVVGLYERVEYPHFPTGAR